MKDNILEFGPALQKRNRLNAKSKKRAKKERREISPDYSSHALERIEERKISITSIESCLENGKRVKKNGAIHYIIENLHVVLDRTEVTILTAYNAAVQKNKLAA